MKLILHGYQGRMGRAILAQTDEIVAGVDVIQTQETFATYKTLAEVKEAADVVIDFSNVSAVADLVADCVAKGLPLVLCTTGLTAELEDKLLKASAHIPIFKSVNMSLGINLMNRFLSQYSGALHALGFDIEILEYHHNQKVDAPSGTAVLLTKTIGEAVTGGLTPATDRYDTQRKRDPKEIGVHSIRGGSIVGKHTVMFAGDKETIELTHTIDDRTMFAKGALVAARFLVGQPAGMYEMAHVLDEMMGK